MSTSKPTPIYLFQSESELWTTQHSLKNRNEEAERQNVRRSHDVVTFIMSSMIRSGCAIVGHVIRVKLNHDTADQIKSNNRLHYNYSV